MCETGAPAMCRSVDDCVLRQDCPAGGTSRKAHLFFDRRAKILDQVKPVGDLSRLRCTLANRLRIEAAAIPADDLDRRMAPQPLGESLILGATYIGYGMVTVTPAPSIAFACSNLRDLHLAGGERVFSHQRSFVPANCSLAAARRFRIDNGESRIFRDLTIVYWLSCPGTAGGWFTAKDDKLVRGRVIYASAEFDAILEAK